jgi:hypothetical protein
MHSRRLGRVKASGVYQSDTYRKQCKTPCFEEFSTFILVAYAVFQMEERQPSPYSNQLLDLYCCGA